MIERHVDYTKSDRARHVLDDWDEMVREVREGHAEGLQAHARSASRAREEQGLTGDDAIMVAFEENARDLARVGGN